MNQMTSEKYLNFFLLGLNIFISEMFTYTKHTTIGSERKHKSLFSSFPFLFFTYGVLKISAFLPCKQCQKLFKPLPCDKFQYLTVLEKCCMPSAYLQWRFHSGERVVARGPLVLYNFGYNMVV